MSTTSTSELVDDNRRIKFKQAIPRKLPKWSLFLTTLLLPSLNAEVDDTFGSRMPNDKRVEAFCDYIYY